MSSSSGDGAKLAGPVLGSVEDDAQDVTLIRSNSLSDAAEYAYAATAPAETRLVFLAGPCPLNSDGSTCGEGDFAAQAAKCIKNMKVALAEVDATLEDVITTRVLVASSDQADLGLRQRGGRPASPGRLTARCRSTIKK